MFQFRYSVRTTFCSPGGTFQSVEQSLNKTPLQLGKPFVRSPGRAIGIGPRCKRKPTACTLEFQAGGIDAAAAESKISFPHKIPQLTAAKTNPPSRLSLSFSLSCSLCREAASFSRKPHACLVS